MRVAAILEAAAAVIAEKGYDGATMAEIAARSGTKIGSLYRFFPSKESIADTMVVSAREALDVLFDEFDARMATRTTHALADDLMNLLFEHFRQPALLKLLDAGETWSVKRDEFRSAILKRTAGALRSYAPHVSPQAADDIALVVVLNVKTVATHQAFFDQTSRLSEEVRDMTRLYLASKFER